MLNTYHCDVPADPKRRAITVTRKPSRSRWPNQAALSPSDWKLETGSGSIEFWAGSAGFTLDASTGSGSVHTEQEMAVQGSFDRHHITGKVHGGGPTVRIETGSGDVRVH